MDHIIVTPKADGYVLLTPEEGYILYNKVTKAHYTEAVVKESKMSQFVAEPISNE